MAGLRDRQIWVAVLALSLVQLLLGWLAVTPVRTGLDAFMKNSASWASLESGDRWFVLLEFFTQEEWALQQLWSWICLALVLSIAVQLFAAGGFLARVTGEDRSFLRGGAFWFLPFVGTGLMVLLMTAVVTVPLSFGIYGAAKLVFTNPASDWGLAMRVTLPGVLILMMVFLSKAVYDVARVLLVQSQDLSPLKAVRGAIRNLLGSPLRVLWPLLALVMVLGAITWLTGWSQALSLPLKWAVVALYWSIRSDQQFR